MDKKRFTGVTIFAWIFIVIGMFGLLSFLNPKTYEQPLGMTGFFKYLLQFLVSGVTLICGIYLLKLKSWARKLTLIICAINIGFSLFTFSAVSKIRDIQEDEFKKQEAAIKEKYKPEFQKEALERLEYTKQISRKFFPVFFAGALTFAVLWNLGVIYFFTRQRVKQQFGEEMEEEKEILSND